MNTAESVSLVIKNVCMFHLQTFFFCLNVHDKLNIKSMINIINA